MLSCSVEPYIMVALQPCSVITQSALLAHLSPSLETLLVQGLPALLAEDPVAQGPVLEMLLLPHFRQLLQPDPALHPPIRLARCAALTQVQACFPRVSPSTVLQALLQMTPSSR